MRTLASHEDTTILLTTHDLDEAEKLCDRIVVLLGGRIVAGGTAAELAARMSGKDEVSYRVAGESFVDSVVDATAHVRSLFERHGDALSDLEVRRIRLEDVYLTMVREFESGARTEFAEVPA